MAGAVAGIAITIAFLATIGSFITYSATSMTARAIGNLPVDWQILLMPGADEKSVRDALQATTPYTALASVEYANVGSFIAKTDGTVQTTGAGKVVGIGDDYRRLFPGQIRELVGSANGVLVTQQTAANLHVRPGDSVDIARVGLKTAQVRVDAIIDLPHADSFFKAIGLSANASPQAPPDNIMLMPESLWHALFDEQAAIRPDSVRVQLHAKIGHNFPLDPNAAYLQVGQLAHNLEARTSGSAVVGDNLAAQLSAVRANAFYSSVLFLFLGVPGILLAILLVLFIINSGEKHRRQEQDLLRVHGASASQIQGLRAAEALGTGICGAALGSILAYAAVGIAIPRTPETGAIILPWIGFSSLAGIALATIAVMRSGLQRISDDAAKPIWKRIYIDLLLLASSAVEFLRIAQSGYTVVLAPEGSPTLSVNYEAFIAPFCLWLGGVLLCLRVYDAILAKRRGLLAGLISPTAGRLSPLVAASLSRDRKFLSRGMLLVALAFSFAVSASIFNTSYTQQARVDAELTNGADVTVTGLVPFAKADARIREISALPGIAGMQKMQHRFAYVGNDLQDIYGIDPRRIKEATNVVDAYFGNRRARATLAALASQPDGVLVSEETVRDFQLKQGDLINLRLQFAVDHAYHAIPFRFVGVVREFPTAPKDSFLVANADYIALMTGNDNSEILLIRSSIGVDGLKRRIEKVVDPVGATISDIGSVQRVIDSGLTSVDLRGLTSFELLFAIVLLAASVGLVLALGMAERRRNFAILTIVGAGAKEINAFIRSECFVILLGGIAAGALLGFGEAQMLVKILSGIFDPPPETLAIPWIYLAILLITAIGSTALAAFAIGRCTKRPAIEEIRLLS